MSRAYCYKCSRSEKTCLCNLIPIINNGINVYVLQHPDEIKNAKGTSIIASLYLQHYQSWVGEDFSQHKALLELVENQFGNTYVVYPNDNGVSLSQWRKATDGQKNKPGGEGGNLIFIDASWRKAKKIWHSAAVLHHLKCITITQQQESSYRIRKIPKSGYISTIEAIAACLVYADKSAEKYRPLLQVFDKMINRQIECMGEQTYNKNYLGDSD
jgi:DTW domain-containing protein YfiP